MAKLLQLVLLSLVALILNPWSFGVHGQILRADLAAGTGQAAEIRNDQVERELQRRRQNGGHAKGKGKGGSKGRNGDDIRFLPSRIDPIPGKIKISTLCRYQI